MMPSFVRDHQPVGRELEDAAEELLGLAQALTLFGELILLREQLLFLRQQLLLGLRQFPGLFFELAGLFLRLCQQFVSGEIALQDLEAHPDDRSSSSNSACSRPVNARKPAISRTPSSACFAISGNATACAGAAAPVPDSIRT